MPARSERRQSHGWSARSAVVLAIPVAPVASLSHWTVVSTQGETTERYQRTVGIDTLHKDRPDYDYVMMTFDYAKELLQAKLKWADKTIKQLQIKNKKVNQ